MPNARRFAEGTGRLSAFPPTMGTNPRFSWFITSDADEIHARKIVKQSAPQERG